MKYLLIIALASSFSFGLANCKPIRDLEVKQVCLLTNSNTIAIERLRQLKLIKQQLMMLNGVKDVHTRK